MKVERSVGATIFREEGGQTLYLLLEDNAARDSTRKSAGTRTDGYWGFPKGHIEKGEKTEETLRREVEEETGVNDLKIIGGFKETMRYFFVWDGEKRLKYVAYFLGKTKTKDIKISFEHIGYI